MVPAYHPHHGLLQRYLPTVAIRPVGPWSQDVAQRHNFEPWLAIFYSLRCALNALSKSSWKIKPDGWTPQNRKCTMAKPQTPMQEWSPKNPCVQYQPTDGCMFVELTDGM